MAFRFSSAEVTGRDEIRRFSRTSIELHKEGTGM